MAAKKGKQSKQLQKKQIGKAFEIDVARFQQLLEPNASVTHDQWLVDRLNNKRQYDVVVSNPFEGPQLGVIECKDHAGRIGPTYIEAFATKARNVGADGKGMVSRNGFTSQALKIAKDENIFCRSPLPVNDKPAFLAMYYTIWQWENKTELFVHLPTETPEVAPFLPGDVLYQDRPVVECLQKELAQKYHTTTEIGPYSVTCMFDNITTLQIQGREYETIGLTFTAYRTCTHRMKIFPMHGEGMYDWIAKQPIVPNNCSIFTPEFKMEDILNWDVCDDVIPENDGFFAVSSSVICISPPIDMNKEVVDLSNL